MKKLLSVLLAVCLVFSMVTIAVVSVSAASTKTITVGVIEYVMNESSSGYQVHYWGGSSTGDANVTALNKTEQKSVGSSYWNGSAQTFTMFTAEIPSDSTGFKVHNGTRWFGDDGNANTQNTVYIFNYSGDKALYEYVESTQPATQSTTESTPSTDITDGFYLIGVNGWDVASLTAADKFSANEAAEGEYMLDTTLAVGDSAKVVKVANGAIAAWYPDGMDNEYTVDDAHAGDVTIYFQEAYKGDWAEFGGYMYIAASAEPDTQPDSQPDTQPSSDPAPSTDLTDGFYLIGVNGWDVASLTAADKFSANEAAEGEYMLDATVSEGDSLKVVKVANGAIAAWYPDGMDNDYIVDAAHAGDVTIYFQEAYKGDWAEFGGYMYIAASSEPETSTTPDESTPSTDLTDGFYLIGVNGWDVASLTAADKFAANEAAEGEYMLDATVSEGDSLKVVKVANGAIAAWYPDGMDNDYIVDAAHAGDVTIYFQEAYKGDWAEFGGYMYIAASSEPETSTTPDESTPSTDLTDGFYLIGVNGWDVASLTAADKFSANEAAEGEYMLDATVSEGDSLKVVKVANGAIVAWYPDGMDNDYIVDAAHAGDVTIYFQETYKGDWAEFGGYMYIAASSEPDTQPDSQPGSDPAPGDVTYYLFGYINGADYADKDDAANLGTYKFVNGKLTATFTETSYVGVKESNNTNWYMTDGYLGDVTSATLSLTSALGENAEKLKVPGNVAVTFTLVKNDDGTLTLSYTTDGEPSTDPAPSTDITDGFYLIGVNGWDVASLTAADKFSANEAAEGEYMLDTILAVGDSAKVVKVANGAIAAWYPDGMDNEYTVDAAHAGNVTIYFQETYKGDWAEFGGYMYIAASAEPDTQPDTQPSSDPTPVTDITDGFYLIGVNGWDVASLTAADKFSANEAAEGEYMLDTTLAVGDSAKVVKVANGAIAAWYPDGMDNEYTVDAAHAGNVTIYFQEAYKGDWAEFGGYMYIAASSEPDTQPDTQPSTDPTPVTDITDGFYLIGVNGWDVASLTAADKFSANEAAEGEYMLDTTLAVGDSAKVVKVANGAIAAWYPDGMDNEYTVDAAHAGDVTIYFQETYKGDWAEFGGYMYITEATEPDTQPDSQPDTQPSSDPEPDTQPVGEDDTYVVAGTPADVFGTTWDETNEDNAMTKDGDVYTKTYTVDKAIKDIQLKVVRNGADWIGDETGNNVTFDMTDAGTFTVTFDPATEKITITGDNVKFNTDLVFETVYAAGNGEGYWLNGAAWDPGYAANEMTKVADGIWEIRFDNVTEGFDRQIKFAIDGTWTHNFGMGADPFDLETMDGEWIDAEYNGSNITFDTEDVSQTVIARLDMRNFDFTTKTGAKMMIDVIYPDEPGPDPQKKLGDVNLDGKIDINDATLLQRYLAEFDDAQLTDEQITLADTDKNGRVDVRDVCEIQRYVAEMITEF